MRLYYRIHNKVRADGRILWYADKYCPLEWSNFPFALIQLVFLGWGWQPMAQYFDGDARSVGATEDEARKVCEADAQKIADERRAYRASIIQKTSAPIAFHIDVE